MVFVKGTDFLLEGGESSFRLAYSGVPPEQIEEGIARLAAARAELAGAKPSVARPAGVTRLELARPRDISALFADALGVYRRNAGTFLALSAAVVVPVHLIVEGVGLEELTAPTTPRRSAPRPPCPRAVSFLVVAPLISAICIHALHASAGGAAPAGARGDAPAGLDVVRSDLPRRGARGHRRSRSAWCSSILPGIYLAVRWYFVPQAVVVDGARGTAALEHSGELVRGALVAHLRAPRRRQPGRA